MMEGAVDNLNLTVEDNGTGELTLSDGKSSPTKETTDSEAVTIGQVDMDEEVLQEHAQAVVEELLKRGACTTLALARMLGMGKSTELNPLLYLLQEKNVIVRVTDVPPIWSLSPDFPMSRLHMTSDVIQVTQPAKALAPRDPFPRALASPLPLTGLGSSLSSLAGHPSIAPTDSFHAKEKVGLHRDTKPIITFPPIPAEPDTVAYPIATPVTPRELQQISADYWRGLSQNSNGNDNRNGGPTFRKWKKQKNLSELQLRLLKELKERGPTRTLDLSKSVGLLTCRDVNPSIYNLKQRNLVFRVSYSPAVWQLNEPGMTRANISIHTEDDTFIHLEEGTAPDSST